MRESGKNGCEKRNGQLSKTSSTDVLVALEKCRASAQPINDEQITEGVQTDDKRTTLDTHSPW